MEQYPRENFIRVSNEGHGKYKQLQERAAKFGDSLMILDYDNTVEQHIGHLNLLPDAFIERMKEKDLRIVLGSRESVWELVRQTQGIKYRLDDIRRKFLSFLSQKKKKEYQSTEAIGLYEEWLKTAFVNGANPGRSTVLHEYGHGVGELLKMDGYKCHEHPFCIDQLEILRPKLHLDVFESRDAIASKEVFAEAFADFFICSRKQFLSLYGQYYYHYIIDILTDGL